MESEWEHPSFRDAGVTLTNGVALAEGRKGGQYFTPKSIVSLTVEMLEPYQGRVYDPAMGSGGFFVQSERFIEEHGGKLGNLSVQQPPIPTVCLSL